MTDMIHLALTATDPVTAYSSTGVVRGGVVLGTALITYAYLVSIVTNK